MNGRWLLQRGSEEEAAMEDPRGAVIALLRDALLHLDALGEHGAAATVAQAMAIIGADYADEMDGPGGN